MQVTCLVLAGGRGLRLRPLTWFVPKALVPIGRRHRLIEESLGSCQRLARHFDVSTVVLAREKAGQIRRFLRGRSDIEVFVEHRPLGTGGAILQYWMSGEFGTPDFVAVLPADHGVVVNLDDPLSALRDQSSDIVLCCIQSEEPHHNYLNLRGGRVVGVSPVGERTSSLAFTGIWCVTGTALTEQLERLVPDREMSTREEIIGPLLNRHVSRYYLLSDSWEDLGTWPRYLGFLVKHQSQWR